MRCPPVPSRRLRARGEDPRLQPTVDRQVDLLEHALPGPPRGLEEIERVVAALDHVQAGPPPEALQDGPEEREITQRVARALKEQERRGDRGEVRVPERGALA